MRFGRVLSVGAMGLVGAVGVTEVVGTVELARAAGPADASPAAAPPVPTLRSAPATELPVRPPAPAGEQVFLSEDFETGELPDTWLYRRRRPDSGDFPGSWFIVPTDPVVARGEGQYMAWASWDSTESADEWMITPRLDLSDPDLTEVQLEFLRVYHDPVQWADSASFVVRASRDDGASFPDTLYRVGTSSRPGAERASVDLSAYVGISTVRVGFQYFGKNGDSAGLDAVVIQTGLPVSARRRTWGALKAGF